MFTLLKTIMMFLSVPVFLIGTAGYWFVRLKLRPREKDMEETYYEFEDRHPAFRRYEFWSRITLTLVVLSMLLIFLVIAL